MILCSIILLLFSKDSKEIEIIKSDKQLLIIYKDDDLTAKDILANIVILPFSFLVNDYYNPIKDTVIFNPEMLENGTSFNSQITIQQQKI